jgi:GYF domain 2
MTASYTVKLPDGNEYGPVDLATLRSWHEEGRISGDTWVWPEGSPEWLTLMDVLAGAGGDDGTRQEQPIRLKQEPKEHRPVSRTPRLQPSTPPPAVSRRGRGSILVGALALALLLGGVAFWFLSPTLEKERASARTAADALPERRFTDDGLGLALDLPEGWLLLRSDSALFVAPQARARFAHAKASAHAALHVESIPPGVISLDSFIDRVVDLRRPLLSDYREVGRVDVTQGARPARRLQASWLEHGAEQRVTVVATRDAWAYAALAVWGPTRGGASVQDAIDALLRGLQLSGVLTSRLKAAADVVEPELPELSRSSLELILCDRLGSGGAPEETADAAVRAVSQGLAALSPAEAQELQQVYAMVYEPMPEESRQRLAAWQREVRAGRKVAAEEAAPIRLLLRDALLALPEEARLRLQGLNEKAIAAAYALR